MRGGAGWVCQGMPRPPSRPPGTWQLRQVAPASSRPGCGLAERAVAARPGEACGAVTPRSPPRRLARLDAAQAMIIHSSSGQPLGEPLGWHSRVRRPINVGVCPYLASVRISRCCVASTRGV